MIKINIKKELYGSNGKMNLVVNTNFNEKDFILITGPSGSGKTTLLRILAGLEKSSGTIEVGNRIWQDEKTMLLPQNRSIGFVFQDYALFPNMTVLENLLYVRKDIHFARYLLKITKLEKFVNRLPNSLSGGQKQRLCLCRAMMNQPKVLLLDEPLSALDSSMREYLQEKIKIFHKELKTTTFMVSHEPSEIYKLSNNVIVLKAGRVINEGSAKEIFLKTSENELTSLKGVVIDIKKNNTINTAIISIGNQLVEVQISNNQTKNIEIGQNITLKTTSLI